VHGIGTAPRARGEGELAVESAHAVEATVKLAVSGQSRLCVAEGNGPVDALSHALGQALTGAYPVLGRMTLTDYKVRVVNSADGTGARVRVLIEHEIDRRRFSTVGVHANIIEASWKALVDAIDYGVSIEASSRLDELAADLGGDSSISAVADLIEGRR
jgi:hypothetical protein